jgi:hypothetical protein
MKIYPFTNTTADFLLQRPDFYLGSFLGMFADKFPSLSLIYPCGGCKNETSLKSLIANLVKQEFKQFGFDRSNRRQENGNKVMDTIKDADYETILEIVKLSLIETGPLNARMRDLFESKYVNSSVLPILGSTVRPVFKNDTIGMIPFCETAAKLSLSEISAAQPTKCSHFKPVITAKGFCYSYNSLSMAELFRPNRYQI